MTTVLPCMNTLPRYARLTFPRTSRAPSRLIRCPQNRLKVSRALADLAVSGARVTVRAKLTFRNSDLQPPWFEPSLARLAYLEVGDDMVIGSGSEEFGKPVGFPLLHQMIDYREEVTMARPTLPGKGKRTTPPGKRAKIKVLDVVIVIGGIIGIMAFNRMSIARLQRSLPNANNQIVGEWKSTRGPEHLVFRADKTVSMTVPANPAEDNAALAAPETNGPAPVTGKYVVVQGGKVVSN